MVKGGLRGQHGDEGTAAWGAVAVAVAMPRLGQLSLVVGADESSSLLTLWRLSGRAGAHHMW